MMITENLDIYWKLTNLEQLGIPHGFLFLPEKMKKGECKKFVYNLNDQTLCI